MLVLPPRAHGMPLQLSATAPLMSPRHPVLVQIHHLRAAGPGHGVDNGAMAGRTLVAAPAPSAAPTWRLARFAVVARPHMGDDW